LNATHDGTKSSLRSIATDLTDPPNPSDPSDPTDPSDPGKLSVTPASLSLVDICSVGGEVV
jgi:hypothetical protein